MAKDTKRIAAEAAEKAAARVNAAARDSSQPLAADDVSSAASSTLPAAPDSVDACGDSPRDHGDGSQVELIYSRESDGGSDSEKTPRSPESTGAAECEPSRRIRSGSQSHGHYQSLFGSGNEHAESSPVPATAHSPFSKRDDGLHHRDGDASGTKTLVGTTHKALDGDVLRLGPEHKPWVLPERLVNELSCETSTHNRIYVFDARLLYGLVIALVTFALRRTSIGMLF